MAKIFDCPSVREHFKVEHQPLQRVFSNKKGFEETLLEGKSH